MKKKVWLLILILTVPLAGALWWQSQGKQEEAAPVLTRTVRVTTGEMLETLFADGSVEAIDRVELRGRSPGEIVEVHVTEGQVVAAGDPIVTLDTRDLQFDLVRAEENLQNALSALASVEVSMAIQELESASQIARATANVEQAQERLASLKDNTPEHERISAERDLRQAQAIYDAALGLDKLRAARSRVHTEERNVALVKEALAAAHIRSPISGTITNLPVKVGDLITSNTALASIVNFNRVQVVTAIDEFDIRHIQPEQEAIIVADAYPDRSFRGTVTRIADEADRGNLVTFRTMIEVPNPRGVLRPGMTVEIEIITERREGVLMVTSSAIRYQEGRPYVVVRADGEEETRRVETGLNDGTNIEILSGLSVGEFVVVETSTETFAPTTTRAPAPTTTLPGLSTPSVPGTGGGRSR